MINTITYALLGGILPALVWLIFWLREDKKNPEPRLYIFTTFLLGMGGVLLITVGAFIFDEKIGDILDNMTIYTLISLATLEEFLKFGAAYIGGLHGTEDNEPIDPMIYMITAALGFVALENALFIFGPLVDGEITRSIITGHMRFVGASLLHVVSSGIIGVALSFTFYKSLGKKVVAVIFAIIGAIAFHTFFNAIITLFKDNGATIAAVAVWVGVIFLLWAFEKAKSIAPQN